MISQILPQAAGVLKSKSYWLKNFESYWSCHKGSPKDANSQMILLPEATAKSKKIHEKLSTSVASGNQLMRYQWLLESLS
jgi:hypothetical protein